MNIVIDIGNTRTKIGVFKSDQLLHQHHGTLAEVLGYVKKYNPDQLIVSAVGNGLEEVVKAFQGQVPLLVFDRTVKLPLEVDYDTPETLGLDRMAAAVGASVIMPDQDVLVVDIGSCMTLDLLKQGKVFCGGAISPGVNLRFKAMHEFTAKLPLLHSDQLDNVSLPGKSTKECMIAGVLKAMEFEIAGHIKYYQSLYPDLGVIITGGDAPYFENKFNTPIFTKDSLVLVGLNRVLEYHVA